MRVDADALVLREHERKVERALLMAILNGHSMRDMEVSFMAMSGGELVSKIIGKRGVLINELRTGRMDDWCHPV